MSIANLEYEWITYEDLKAILSDVEFINKEDYESLSSLDQIEKICLLFKELYLDAKIDFVKIENKSTFEKYYATSSSQEKAEKCFLLGFNIVYRLRAFLLQEDILVKEMMFSKNEPIGTYEKTMTEILKNKEINVKLNQGIVNLSTTLSKIDKKDLKKDHLDKWNRILSYAGFDNVNDFSPEPGDTFRYNDHTYQRFRHQKDSRDVVITGNFEEKKNLKYYYMRGESYMNFNRGNLFEWFESAMAHYSESTIKSPKKLFNLIMDNNTTEGIAGYKQGDYYSKKEQIWIQSKYGNHTLMQLSSIANVILSSKGTVGILEIIQKYKQSKDGIKIANKQIQQDFLDLFTTKKNKINRVFDDQIGINKYTEIEKNNNILINLGII